MTRRQGNLIKPPGARFYQESYSPQAWENYLQQLEKLGTPHAVARLDGMPSQGAFEGKMKRDPGFAQRAQAVWKRGHRSTNRSDADWRAFLLKLTELGQPHLVSKVAGMPSYSAYKDKRLRDPRFAQQVEAIRRRHAISAQTWETLLKHLSSFGILDACSQPGMPTAGTMQRRRQVDAAFNARVVAIIRDPVNRHLHQSRFDIGWDRVVEILGGSSSIKAACAVPGMPGTATITRRARVDLEFRAVLADIVRRQTRARITLCPAETFKLALSRNELYAAVAVAVPKSLPPITRDDIICDMMLAVLEGQIDVGEIKVRAKDFVREHWRMFGTLRDKSLDAAMFDGARTLGDSLVGHGADYW